MRGYGIETCVDYCEFCLLHFITLIFTTIIPVSHLGSCILNAIGMGIFLILKSQRIQYNEISFLIFRYVFLPKTRKDEKLKHYFKPKCLSWSNVIAASHNPVVVMKFEFCAQSARLLRKLDHVLLWILSTNTGL